MSDFRYALRALVKNPIYSLTIVAVLTLGIGLNAAVFTMLKSMALSPIAGVDRASQLAVVFGETSAGRQAGVSYPDYQQLRDRDRAFASLFGTSVTSANLGRGRDARPVWAELVTGNFFQVLGVRAQRGRTLLPSDEVSPGGHPIVVISDTLWRHDFGADPDIVGKAIELNNTMLTVVGISDPTFHGTTVVYDVQLFIPVMMAPDLGVTFRSQQTTAAGILGDRRASVFYPLGYLAPNTTLAGAAAQTDALWTALLRDRPLDDAVQRLRVVRFWQTPNGAPSIMLPTLVVLCAMGLLVLAIACANIAGLVLVRAVSRRGEIGVRLALGATRARIVRLLVVENLVLALPGVLLGILVARRTVPFFVGYAERMAVPARLFFNAGVDGLVVGFAALVACGSALLCGFVPALQSSRVDLVSVVNEDASPRGASRGRLRSVLVVAQVAVSLMLLVGAGLATRSVDAARHANPGFDASHTTAVTLEVKQNAYDEARGRVFYRKLLDASRAGAGIESATLAAYTPLSFLDTPARPAAIEGYEPRRGEDMVFTSNSVGPDYFRTLRIPVLAGREFQDRDDESAAPVAIVNGTLAQRFWGGATNAIGRRIRIADGNWRTIVGVAADVKYSRINEPPRPYGYVPFFQSYRSSMTLHTRGAAPVDRLVDQARAAVTAIDPDMPVVRARSMADATRGALFLFDLSAAMLFVFGAAGLALAAMGTYALVSYTVRQRTREIGIRMALGATARAVVLTFVTRGVRLGIVGAALGIVVALGASRLLSGVLFGVTATDGVSFGRAIAIVLGGVIVATLVPAWRAARINPLTALRHS
jgi:predicted permease